MRFQLKEWNYILGQQKKAIMTIKLDYLKQWGEADENGKTVKSKSGS